MFNKKVDELEKRVSELEGRLDRRLRELESITKIHYINGSYFASVSSLPIDDVVDMILSNLHLVITKTPESISLKKLGKE